MQWLIDIMVERIRIDGMFVDRGDPAAWDFDKGDLLQDGAWHDLDLSAIVPENAHAVLLHLVIRDNVIGSFVQFRRKGNVNSFNRSELRTQVANLWNDADPICSLDANRMIQYRTAGVGFTSIDIGVRGWWY